MTKIFENRLKKRLAGMPIEKLLEKMNNNRYYFPYNIWKKVDRNYIEGGKWISWFATRQAEKLNDLKHTIQLKQIIADDSTNKATRRSAYFCLGHISRNFKNKEIFDFLVQKLRIESDENKEIILISITGAEKPMGYNLQPIIDILKTGKMDIKTNAALALKHSHNPQVEIELLNSFQSEKNKQLQKMIAATLRDIGTAKSLPILREKLKTAKGTDYKYFLQSAIKGIQMRESV